MLFAMGDDLSYGLNTLGCASGNVFITSAKVYNVQLQPQSIGLDVVRLLSCQT